MVVFNLIYVDFNEEEKMFMFKLSVFHSWEWDLFQ